MYGEKRYSASYGYSGIVGSNKYDATTSPGYVKGPADIDQNPVLRVMGKIQV